jgi:hypothetical protein
MGGLTTRFKTSEYRISVRIARAAVATSMSMILYRANTPNSNAPSGGAKISTIPPIAWFSPATRG